MDRAAPIVLCILDGWGHRNAEMHNAIAHAHTPHWDQLCNEHPHSLLGTSGEDVGLPPGVMGNSEVGHMNIGSGRIIMQDLPRINNAIDDGSLAQNPALQKYITTLKTTGGTCHLMGLISDGGVHAHINHIIALARIFSQATIPVAIHAFTDGRDTAPNSGKDFLLQLEGAIKDLENVTIATISGRYYAMDRDKRWERIHLAYDAIAHGKGHKEATALSTIENNYANNIFDEFIEPTVIGQYTGTVENDAILMANFRADRARQLLLTLLDPEFDAFKREYIAYETALGMVEYSEDHNRFIQTIFAPEILNNILGEIISNAGLKQLRVAETEKYAHVTFFFNGGREASFAGEDRILIPSPNVATYDLQPEMSAAEVTEKLVAAINENSYDLIVVNFANTDMVGHTGIEDAAIKAVEAVDTALGKLHDAINHAGGILIVTADHGNAEQMLDTASGQPHTQHTLNPVPFVIAGINENISLKDGRLCDIAPTILHIMSIKQPAEMTGHSLIEV